MRFRRTTPLRLPSVRPSAGCQWATRQAVRGLPASVEQRSLSPMIRTPVHPRSGRARTAPTGKAQPATSLRWPGTTTRLGPLTAQLPPQAIRSAVQAVALPVGFRSPRPRLRKRIFGLRPVAAGQATAFPGMDPSVQSVFLSPRTKKAWWSPTLPRRALDSRRFLVGVSQLPGLHFLYSAESRRHNPCLHQYLR